MVTYTLGEIASRLGGKVRGDASRTISGIKPLDEAGPQDLSFVAHPRHRPAAVTSRAACLIARPADDLPGHNVIQVANPYAALAAAMKLFFPEQRSEPGISKQAVIGDGTTLGEGLSIGPSAVVGRDCVLGDRITLKPGVVLGDGVHVGAETMLHPAVVVYRGSRIGARVIVHAGTVIGSDGFGFADTGESRDKIPQIGNVVIEDDVEIGACTTIDRATFGSTVIGRGTKIDNLVQVAHNVVIGENSVLVAQSGIAGSTRLGRSVIIAGQSGVAGHLEVGDGAVVGAKSAVLKKLPAGSFVVGHPATDHRVWKRAQVAVGKLPELLQRVGRLEKALAASQRSRRRTGSARRLGHGTKARARRERAG